MKKKDIALPMGSEWCAVFRTDDGREAGHGFDSKSKMIDYISSVSQGMFKEIDWQLEEVYHNGMHVEFSIRKELIIDIGD